MGKRNRMQQAGAIPFRWVDGRLEYCLITSSKSGRWGFPKGFVDPGETPEETALKESHEEAGLEGRLVGEQIGTIRLRKSGTELDVGVWLMEVSAAADEWLEAHVRQRRWETFEAACELIDRVDLRELLVQADERLSANVDAA